MPHAEAHSFRVGLRALAGTANADGWRDLRVDGSSKEAFAQSLEAFKKRLPSAREYAFGEALKDIWIQGAKAAESEQRDYTADEYYRQLDGLRYKEIVKYTDPTGETANNRYRAALSQGASDLAADSARRASVRMHMGYHNGTYSVPVKR
jgi:hypothetical protein